MALYWQPAGQGKVQCFLCPRHCLIPVNQRGFCRARKNIKGELYCLTYGQPVAIHVDPIEKKPLFHVYPGTKSFSIATAGCNLRCKFCQNWEISQLDPESVKVAFVSPEEIVKQAKETGSKTIAFTYTEPTIFYEYMLDIAKLAKQEGIACVMHSSGFINPEPLRQLAKYLTAANIDLKGFSEKYYSSFCEGSLNSVLSSLKILKEAGVWTEVTNLIIPTANDSDEDIYNLCLWIKDNLGPDTPVHFSRFFPMYKLVDLSPTPLETLIGAGKIAQKTGLRYVYLGNITQDAKEDTICPVCGKLLIKRIGYTVLENNIIKGKCKYCGAKISGVWD
ncbi:MAG: AmmeMemoRadiSam system radical SAM enzyme [Candidatus Omnitrophota bacterium]